MRLGCDAGRISGVGASTVGDHCRSLKLGEVALWMDFNVCRRRVRRQDSKRQTSTRRWSDFGNAVQISVAANGRRWFVVVLD